MPCRDFGLTGIVCAYMTLGCPSNAEAPVITVGQLKFLIAYASQYVSMAACQCREGYTSLTMLHARICVQCLCLP